ncbi:MAG: hypothetical protein C4346_00765 [Chloroflexota bacterium]
MTLRIVMILIIDENVPRDVLEFFRERGHLVISIRDILGMGVEDTSIAQRADELMAVIVTRDRDFKRLIECMPTGNRPRFRHEGRMSCDCRPDNRRRRVKELIEYIEFAYEKAQQSRDRRLTIEITETTFRIVR